MWPDVGVKSGPIISKSCSKSSQCSFCTSVRFFKISQKVANDLGFFCKNQELSKITQCGNTHHIYSLSLCLSLSSNAQFIYFLIPSLSPVWPYLVKFCHFPKHLKEFGNIFRAYLVFGTISKAIWQILFAFGLISIVVNIMKKYTCHLVTLSLSHHSTYYSNTQLPCIAIHRPTSGHFFFFHHKGKKSADSVPSFLRISPFLILKK